MTVKGLIEYLNQCPPTALVFFGHGNDDYSDELAVNYVTVGSDGKPDESGNVRDEEGDYTGTPQSYVLLSMEGPFKNSL